MSNILIVDDDQLIREILGDYLQEAGHKIFCARNSPEAIALFETVEIELLLLDIFLEGESGLEIIPFVLNKKGQIPIIVMTAQSSIDTVSEAIRLGVHDYIRKPINKFDLVHTVNKQLETKQLSNNIIGLVEKQSDNIRRLELFERISLMIASTLDLNTLLEDVMKITKSIVGAEASSVLLIDNDTGELFFTVALGSKSLEMKEVRIGKGKGIAGWVIDNKEPLLLNDVQQDPRFSNSVDKKTGFRTKSMIAAPLVVRNKSLGVIEVINKLGGGDFEESDKSILITMAGQIAVAIDNAEMTEDLIKSRAQVEEYSKNLENMVRKRTEALELARKNLEEAQDHLIQSEKLSSLGQLSAGIAHEINNPVSFIKSNIFTMKDYLQDLFIMIDCYKAHFEAINNKGRPSPVPRDLTAEAENIRKKIDYEYIRDDIQKLLNETLDGIYRVTKIVSDLRNFSRMDQSLKVCTDIHNLIDSTLNIVWNEIKYKAEVKKLYGDLPALECYPTELNQVIMNLLVNASHAINDNGLISIKTYREKDNAFIEISDNGEGIKDEVLNKIFDPFFTTKEPGKGTGLGLSISYKIIEKHEGKITVTSEPGYGTTFKIELPIKTSICEPAEAEPLTNTPIEQDLF